MKTDRPQSYSCFRREVVSTADGLLPSLRCGWKCSLGLFFLHFFPFFRFCSSVCPFFFPPRALIVGISTTIPLRLAEEPVLSASEIAALERAEFLAWRTSLNSLNSLNGLVQRAVFIKDNKLKLATTSFFWIWCVFGEWVYLDSAYYVFVAFSTQSTRV